MVEIVATVEIVMDNLEMVVDLIANAEKVDLLALKHEKAIKIEMTEIMEITKVKEKGNSIEMEKVIISKEKVNSIEMVDKTEAKVVKVETKIADKAEINKIVKDLLETEMVLLLLLHQWKKTKRLLQRKLL